MNTAFLNSINNDLIGLLKTRYAFDHNKVLALSEAGRSSLINSLKQFVLKNGTPEIEAILLEQKKFSESPLQAHCYKGFENDLKDKNLLPKEQIKEVAEYSINFLIDRFRIGFRDSGLSRDLDGICKFLDIDKNIVKLANSPMAKMFGKFF